MKLSEVQNIKPQQTNYQRDGVVLYQTTNSKTSGKHLYFLKPESTKVQGVFVNDEFSIRTDTYFEGYEKFLKVTKYALEDEVRIRESYEHALSAAQSEARSLFYNERAKVIADSCYGNKGAPNFFTHEDLPEDYQNNQYRKEDRLRGSLWLTAQVQDWVENNTPVTMGQVSELWDVIEAMGYTVRIGHNYYFRVAGVQNDQHDLMYLGCIVGNALQVVEVSYYDLCYIEIAQFSLWVHINKSNFSEHHYTNFHYIVPRYSDMNNNSSVLITYKKIILKLGVAYFDTSQEKKLPTLKNIADITFGSGAFEDDATMGSFIKALMEARSIAQNWRKAETIEQEFIY